MAPETRSVDAVVAAARTAGAERIDFYHYGLMRLASLDWIGAALARWGCSRRTPHPD